jgi:NAD(P)-dependent dehydrogenase (short-subunit alcohol dehydrogenase family)
MTLHPVFSAGRVAVITGAASGIGLAAAQRCAGLGMKVCLADIDEAALQAATASVSQMARHADDVIAMRTDVAAEEQVERLQQHVTGTFGEVGLLMNNAATEGGGGVFGTAERWRCTLETNLWGVIHGIRAFVPAMIGQHTPCTVVNTGSKQGITCPPGDTAYNISKAGVKVVSEALAHELRNIPGCRVTAHLLVPGFTYTGFTKARGISEKPPGAWTAEQVIDFMLSALAAGDFYILCPDNETTREMDEKRILWAADDIIKSRPPLSRWHGDYKKAFAEFMAGGKSPG